MPAIVPAGGEVDWPEGEGVLGVVGVAPWATLEFCRCFYSLVPARKDWHFPRVLLDINTKLPSRGRHLQLGETDPSPFIARTIGELAQAGATVAVVACNTAHILFDRWATGAPIPVLHIVREAVLAAQQSGACRLLVLTSSSLADSRLYEHEAIALGLSCAPLRGELQALVSALIESIKTRGSLSPRDEADIDRLLDYARAAQIDTVVLGCTELTAMRAHVERVGLKVVDSNEALARAALAAVCSPR